MKRKALSGILAVVGCVAWVTGTSVAGSEVPGCGPKFALVSVVVDASGTALAVKPGAIEGQNKSAMLHDVRPSDAVARPDGSLVLVEEGDDTAGRLVRFRFDRGVTTEVSVEGRPMRLANAGDTIAVLMYRLHEGFSVRLLDKSLNPAGEFPVSFPCTTEHPPLSGIAASDGGKVYVAYFICDGTYVINQYDMDGNLLRTFQPPATEEQRTGQRKGAAPRDRNTLIPAAADIFVVGEKVGVLLNRWHGDTGIAAEFWTPDGTKSNEVALPGVTTAMSKVAASGDDELIVGNQATGEIATVRIPRF